MTLSHSPNIVRDGLVLYLDAGNSKSYPGSGTTWYDLSGSGNNGTLINGPAYSSNSSGGMVFDGVNDRGTFASPVTSESSQSYEIWTNAVASSNAATSYAYILHNNELSSTTGGSYLTIGVNNTGQYYAAFNGSYLSMLSGVTADNSKNVQIFLTWDGSNQKIYINAELKDTESLTTTPQNFSTTTSFGDYKTSSYRMIEGSIYSIKIYNKALTENEIQQNFNALRGRYGI